MLNIFKSISSKIGEKIGERIATVAIDEFTKNIPIMKTKCRKFKSQATWGVKKIYLAYAIILAGAGVFYGCASLFHWFGF